MALKDRLEARRQGSDGAAGDGQLTVLEGMRGAPPVAPQQPGALDDQAQKSTRTPLAFAAVKGAIHEMLVERHADEIDITDRVGVKSRIASLAEEYARTASITLNRLINAIKPWTQQEISRTDSKSNHQPTSSTDKP